MRKEQKSVENSCTYFVVSLEKVHHCHLENCSLDFSSRSVISTPYQSRPIFISLLISDFLFLDALLTLIK